MRISDLSSDVCSSDLHAGPPPWGPRNGSWKGAPGSPRSDDTAAQHQPDDADDDHDDVEIPPAIAVGHRAERQPDDSDRDHQPVRPAEKGNESRTGQKQGVERSEEHTYEHQSLMRSSYDD